MIAHSAYNAQRVNDCKRLLRYGARYGSGMHDGPAERLRAARANAGFETAVDAAKALGVPVSTYIGHENGSRGYSAVRAALYARRYKVTEEWLLYGKGDGPSGTQSAEILQLFDFMPPDRRAEALDILRLLARRPDSSKG